MKQGLRDYALYKSTIDIDIDIDMYYELSNKSSHIFIFNSPRKVGKTIYNKDNSTQCTAVTRQLAKNSQRCS